MDPSNRSYLLNTAVFHFYIVISTLLYLVFLWNKFCHTSISTLPQSHFWPHWGCNFSRKPMTPHGKWSQRIKKECKDLLIIHPPVAFPVELRNVVGPKILRFTRPIHSVKGFVNVFWEVKLSGLTSPTVFRYHDSGFGCRHLHQMLRQLVQAPTTFE